MKLHLPLLGALCASAACATPLPPDSGAFNVKAYGAKGDGRADDTAAIRATIAAAQVDQGKGFWPARIVYFPAGEYRVTDTIVTKDASGSFVASVALIGESRTSVRLHLADHAVGFGDASAPKPLLLTSSKLLGGSPTAGGKNYLVKGEGNDAYGNFIEDMTIDVGSANPGAVAVDFIANNVGAIRHVTLAAPAGSGRIGLDMERKWPGPLLITDLQVDGFAVGMAVSQPDYSVTVDGLTLRGQTDVALRNDGNVLAMRNLNISGTALAVQNKSATGLIDVDGLVVSTVRADGRWLDNTGYLTLARADVKVNGLPVGASVLDKSAGGAWYQGMRLADYDAGWRLPAASAPAPYAPAVKDWANVVRFGARPDTDTDASPAIAAAFASGAAVVYFPSGRYKISEPITVPASVRRIVGLKSAISIGATRASTLTREHGMVRVATDGEALTIESLAFDNTNRGSQVGIEHAGARTLVLRDLITAGVSMQRTSGGGKLFVEDACCGSIRVAGPNGAWMTQFNSEGSGTRIVNEGSPLSILGVKTEQNCTVLENLAGAVSDVVGGLVYQVHPPVKAVPAFVNHAGARLYVSYAEEAYLAGSAYEVHVTGENKDGTWTDLHAADLPARGARARLVPGRAFQTTP